MEPILLREEAWQYKLQKLGAKYVLSVPCGSSAMYELNVPIAQEIAEAGLDDPSVLALLAQTIKNDPDTYMSHQIKLN